MEPGGGTGDDLVTQTGRTGSGLAPRNATQCVQCRRTPGLAVEAHKCGRDGQPKTTNFTKMRFKFAGRILPGNCRTSFVEFCLRRCTARRLGLVGLRDERQSATTRLPFIWRRTRRDAAEEGPRPRRGGRPGLNGSASPFKDRRGRHDRSLTGDDEYQPSHVDSRKLSVLALAVARVPTQT